MGGRSTRSIRSIGRGEGGHLFRLRPKPSEDPSTDPADAGRATEFEVLLQLFGDQQRGGAGAVERRNHAAVLQTKIDSGMESYRP